MANQTDLLNVGDEMKLDDMRQDLCGSECDEGLRSSSSETAEELHFSSIPTHVETVCLLTKLNVKQHIEVELMMDEMDLTMAESKATYEEIKNYVKEKTGLQVSNLYIAQIKRKCGIIERINYNLPKSETYRQPQCPSEKETAI